MNKFLAIFKAENILNSIKNIFSRFPISALISIITTIIFILAYQKRIIENLWFDTEVFFNIWISFIVTFFLSLWAYIFSEWLKLSKSKSNLIQIFAIIYWILFYFYFSSNINNFSGFAFSLLNIVITISLLFFAPFIKKIFCKKEENCLGNQENFYSYFFSILTTILFAFTVSLSFFALTSIWFYTIETLFDVRFLNNKIPYIFIISSCFIAPFIGLNNIPKKETFENWKFNENPFSLFMTKYIAIPFIFTYFVILYAYSIKVLANFTNWPKGEVSWLVIIFSIFWYFTYLVSYMYEEKISFVKKFRKFFPFVVVPQIFILFYAIYLRINQYWITINRYFVVVFGIWLLTISIYYIFSKRKYLAHTFVLLFLFSSIISIWPWSFSNLPQIAQKNALKEDLKEVWILKDSWEIVPLKKEDLSDKNYKVREKISEKIDYLCQYHNCEKLVLEFVKDLKKLDFRNSIRIIDWKEVFEKLETKEDLKRFSNWELKNALKDYFNLEVYSYYKYEKNEQKDLKEIFIDSYPENNFYDIKWYDFYLTIDNFNKEHVKKERLSVANLDFENKKIEIFINWNFEWSVDINEILEKIIKENSKDRINKIVKSIEFKIENEKIKAKIFIQNLRIYVKDEKIVFQEDKKDYKFENFLNWVLIFSKK